MKGVVYLATPIQLSSRPGMADWHVSDSDSDDREMDKPSTSNFSGVPIDRHKLLSLLKAVEKSKTLELDCLSRVTRKKHKLRLASNGAMKKRKVEVSPSGGRSAEEVSETASEVRSTFTASTATECRDSRRPGLSAFDFQDDHDFPALTGKFKKKPRLHRQGQQQHFAKMDDIMAGIRREKVQQQQSLEEKCLHRITEDPSKATSDLTLETCIQNGNSKASQSDQKAVNLELSFGDGDSDLGSPLSGLDGMTSQINRIEQILDADGFT